MNYHLLSILFVFLCSSLKIMGQNNDSLHFAIGVEYFQNEDFQKAIESWKIVLANGNDSSLYYGRSFNNIPIAYASLDSVNQAEVWFQKIFASNLNDMDKGNSIMEPYANYRHNAAMVCAKMFARKNNYKKALQYVWLADTLYTDNNYSGTGFERRCVSISAWKHDFYMELNDVDSALYVLLHKVLDREIKYRHPNMISLSSIDFYAPIRKDLILTINEKIGTPRFRKDLNKALRSSKIVTEAEQDFIEFYLYDKLYKIGITVSKKDFIERIKFTTFYEML